MPSAVKGPSKEGYVWVINDAEDKMYVPEGTIMGIGQDWEEEEQDIVEYSEPMGAIRGVEEGILEHTLPKKYLEINLHSSIYFCDLTSIFYPVSRY